MERDRYVLLYNTNVNLNVMADGTGNGNLDGDKNTFRGGGGGPRNTFELKMNGANVKSEVFRRQ